VAIALTIPGKSIDAEEDSAKKMIHVIGFFPNATCQTSSLSCMDDGKL
jgi:hypothetical protein